jgi:nucleotide-binding universal stress UspA family protein
MTNHKRILVALSLSDGRDAAFERGLALAAASGSELYLLHAVPADHAFSDHAAARLRRAAELRQRAAAAGVSALAVEQQGDPAEIIVLHAEARPADLIVMGHEQRTGWARFRRRSVAERVLRLTKRPTLVVPNDDTGEGPGFENILVAVDLSPASPALIDTALRLSGDRNRQLTVLHAVDGVGMAGDGWMEPEYRGDVLAAARLELASLVPSASVGDVGLRIEAGTAAQAIGTCAAELKPDLIVMGRNRHFLPLAPTAVRVLRSTDRPLLIVPAAEAAPAIAIEPRVHDRAA